MDKTVKGGVGELAGGIPGFYRTRRYKIRVIALMLAVLILVSVAVIGVIVRERVWNGKVYVFSYISSVYEHFFYTKGPIAELLYERDMTKGDFEQAARVTVTERKYMKEDWISDEGLADDVPPLKELKKLHGATFYIVVLDGDGKCVYSGTDINEFVDALVASGF